MNIKRKTCVFATITAAVLPGLASAQWTATSIHPGGFNSSAAGGMSGGQLLGWSFPSGQGQFQAGYWTSATPAGFTSLHQAAWLESSANASDGVNQFGYVRSDLATGYKAAMWSGTAASFTSYHPDAYKQSAINSLAGGKMGGWVMGNDDKRHAAIWNGGGPNNLSDLTPGGFDESMIYGMTATHQVGHTGNGATPRAALWAGSAASYVDLGPAGTDASDAFAVDGDWQAGWGLFTGDTDAKAVLWNGTAASALNLNPTGADGSALNDVKGGWQVGDATFGSSFHAGLWSGTGDSFEDLHSFLAPGFTSSSAISIEILPDVINVYGYGINVQTENWQAIVWSKPVPEPASMAALGLGVAALLRKRRAKRAN